MTIKCDGQESTLIQICGRFPAGSVIGQDIYFVALNDASDQVSRDDRFCCIDDLKILELFKISGILQEYYAQSHIPSDIPLN